MARRQRYHRDILAICAALIAIAATLAGCGADQASRQHNSEVGTGRTPITVRAVVDRYVYRTVNDLCTAPLVGEVVVSGRGQSYWNTPDGALPTTVTAANALQSRYALYTPVTFAHITIYEDHRTASTRQFVTLGGTNGQDSYYLDGFPQLTIDGRYVVVFVPTETQQGAQLNFDTMAVFDAFPIDANDIVTLQQASSPNEPGAGTPAPRIAMPLAQLQQALARC